MALDRRDVARRFVASAEREPNRVALDVEGRGISYSQLSRDVAQLSAALDRIDEDIPLVAIFAQRSKTAYSAVLATLCSGRGYVPLNPKFPANRIVAMIRKSGSRAIVVDEKRLALLDSILEQIDEAKWIITPDADPADLKDRFPQHRFIGASELGSREPSLVLSSPQSPYAYLMFTSGSTGEPKGIAVTRENVATYVDTVCRRYDVQPEDRLSQTFDLTFDLSVHDLFVTWSSGASLHVPKAAALMAPAKFIREHELTMWFSVPSVIATMDSLGMLVDNAFPTLRWSLFCGEPLTEGLAQAWHRAAPNAVIENLYGPTEATIAITGYRWNAEQARCSQEIVPIGHSFEGQRTEIVGPDLQPLPDGQPGELCLSGSQITPGYWQSPELTRASFVSIPGRAGTYYRTGDVAVRDADGTLRFRGRLDHQVKVRGHRVELQEVDTALRRASGCNDVVSIAWPQRHGSADGIVTFLRAAEAEPQDSRALRAKCRTLLPDYMIPRKIVRVDEWPLNANGKVDRAKLRDMLETPR